MKRVSLFSISATLMTSIILVAPHTATLMEATSPAAINRKDSATDFWLQAFPNLLSEASTISLRTPSMALTPSAGATISVNSTTDVADGDTSSISALIATPGPDGVISLREAIIAANNTAGADAISFNIPGGGVKTIKPLS